VTLRVDCNQGYGATDVIKMIREIEQFDIELVEQPTVWWDFATLAKVAVPLTPHYATRVPILHGRRKDLIDMGAIGVLG